MWMKMLGFPGKTTTLEEYKAAVRRRVNLFWGLSALGALTLAVTVLLVGGQAAETGDAAHLHGFWCGIGAGLIVAGSLLATRTRALLKNEEKLRRAQLEEQDERNQAVTARALSLTAAVLVFGIYAAMLVASFFSMTVFYTLLCCAVSGFALLFLFRAVLSRRM